MLLPASPALSGNLPGSVNQGILGGLVSESTLQEALMYILLSIKQLLAALNFNTSYLHKVPQLV